MKDESKKKEGLVGVGKRRFDYYCFDRRACRSPRRSSFCGEFGVEILLLALICLVMAWMVWNCL